MPALSGTDAARPITRLHVGCGSHAAPGWINADRHPGEGIELCADLRDGLPIDDASVDYAVAMHVLQDLPWDELPGVLAELRRVLRPGGTLRLGLPDLDRAFDAYRRGDADYFHVPDRDAASIGAKLVTQLVWYGSVRTPFCFDFARELLEGAGFRAVRRSRFGHSDSGHPDIATLDNRERETLFVEAQA